jgi:hypothetical protein
MNSNSNEVDSQCWKDWVISHYAIISKLGKIISLKSKKSTSNPKKYEGTSTLIIDECNDLGKYFVIRLLITMDYVNLY